MNECIIQDEMGGRELLAQTVTLMSFASAGLIGGAHVIHGVISDETETPPQLFATMEESTLSANTHQLVQTAPSYPLTTQQASTASPPVLSLEEGKRDDVSNVPIHNPLHLKAGFSATHILFREVVERAIAPASAVRVVVDLSDRQVMVMLDATPVSVFPIAVGRPGWETPIGEFRVIDKQKNPIWQNPITNQIVEPGSTNPLGIRWISFWSDGKNQLGFHGTYDTELIGQAVSHGCIRMYNEHIQQFYDQISIGTPVHIQP